MGLLPKNERVKIDPNAHWRLWLYGESYTGKTFLANKFPNVLMLNTDGNTDEVDAPRLRIANQYEQNGRVTNEIPAWKYFKSVIAELRKGDNGYETIVLDLIEDFYEYCRQYVCKEILHVNHESDANFKAWDMVRTEFYSVIRDLFSLPYNFILLSQEDKSRDIMERSGDKFTAIRPNIADKVALKLEGMCTLTARVLMKGKNQRVISFKTSDVIFGGGRIQIPVEEIPCEYEPLINILMSEQTVRGGRNETKFNEPLESPKQNGNQGLNEPTNSRPEPQTDSQFMVSEEPTPQGVNEGKPERRRRTVVAEKDETPTTDPVEFGINTPETPETPAEEPKNDETPAIETPAEEPPKKRRRRRVVEDEDENTPF